MKAKMPKSKMAPPDMGGSKTAKAKPAPKLKKRGARKSARKTTADIAGDMAFGAR